MYNREHTYTVQCVVDWSLNSYNYDKLKKIKWHYRHLFVPIVCARARLMHDTYVRRTVMKMSSANVYNYNESRLVCNFIVSRMLVAVPFRSISTFLTLRKVQYIRRPVSINNNNYDFFGTKVKRLLSDVSTI